MTIKLKAKILLGLTFLLIFSILFNLFYSYQLFLQDKTSYIYENGLKRAESISDNIVSLAQTATNRINAFSFLAIKDENQFQKVINSEQEIMAFAIRPFNQSQWKVFVNESDDSEDAISTEIYDTWIRSNVETSDFSNEFDIESINLEGRDYLYIRVSNSEFKALYLLSLKKVFASISSDRVFKHYVFDNSNNSLFVSEKVPSYAKNISMGKLTKGTKQFSVDNEDMLVSFVKFPSFNFTLASEISKAKAFAITEILIKRNLYFGMILLGISLVLGLFFSLRITKPINQLVSATRWVAKGNFDQQIDIKTSDELKILGESFNYMSGEINQLLADKQDMIEKLEVANLQLEDYSKNLELKVEERTAELKTANDFIAAMINSLDQGLFVFDKSLKCADVYTKACEDLFNKNPSGLAFTEVLDLSEKEANSVEKWAEIVFANKIPFKSASALGPQKKVTGDSVDDPDFKHVKLEYYPMEDDEGISNLVVVSTDMTKEIKAQQVALEKEKYVEMIIKLVKSKKQFFNFIDEAGSILDEIKALLQDSNPSLDSLLINYHSLNGGFGTFSVLKLQTLARECEQDIVDFKDVPLTEDHLKVLRDDFENYLFEYNNFLQEIDQVFGDNDHIVEIDKELILAYAERLKQRSQHDLYELFIDYFEREPIGEQFASYIELVDKLSGVLNKPIAPVTLIGGDIRVDVSKTKEFTSSLVHLFRNCCDHGIEKDVNQRIERGKSEEGHISVEIDKRPSAVGGEEIVVTVTDDGGGINPEIIRSKLIEKNPDQDFSSISDEDIIYKIFDPSFSTADQVTSVSGRGVGMSAIKDVLDRAGGRIVLDSKVGKGTRFVFFLPYS